MFDLYTTERSVSVEIRQGGVQRYLDSRLLFDPVLSRHEAISVSTRSAFNASYTSDSKYFGKRFFDFFLGGMFVFRKNFDASYNNKDCLQKKLG